jgi:Cu/Ag efflux protein CusF
MRHARILLAAALFAGVAGLAHAQQTIKGKVTAVDKAASRILIQIAGTAATSGTGAATAPTPFKVANPQLLDGIGKGDQVTVTTENVNGTATVKTLHKE